MILLDWSLFGCSILSKRYHKHRDVPHIVVNHRPHHPYDIYKHKFLETIQMYRAFSHEVTAAKQIGVPKQRNGGHVGVPRQPCGNWTWTLFLCRNFLLFAKISIYAGHVREYPLLSLVRTPQEMRQFYLSPLEKRFYSTLYLPNMNDVTFPLSLQKFILGIFTIQNLTFWIIHPLQKNLSPSIDPSENPPGRKSLNDPSIVGGEGGNIMEWPWTQQISLAQDCTQ